MASKLTTRKNAKFETEPASVSEPAIDLWYGSEQVFGLRGLPQRWINIPGRVSNRSDLSSLSYSLNGGPLQPLSIGPTRYRLASAGDFNIEIDHAELSSESNSIEIVALDNAGHQFTERVNVRCERERVWPLPHETDWSAVPSIQEAAQVVDGLWRLEGESIRSREMGYDRLIAIGDISWTDYEITVPITIHGFDSSGFRNTSGGPGVGVLMRWEGHRDWSVSQPLHGRWPLSVIKRWRAQSDRRGNQPRRGWWPVGALGWYKWHHKRGYRLNITGNRGAILAEDLSGRTLEPGICYMFKMRVETRGGQGSLYRLKVWERDGPEPDGWDLSGQGVEGELRRGSLLLVAHHIDASFGNISIVPV